MAAKGTFGKGTLLRRQFPQGWSSVDVSQNAGDSLLYLLDANAANLLDGRIVHYYESSAHTTADRVQNIVVDTTTLAGTHDQVNFKYPHGVYIQIQPTGIAYYDYETVANITSITGPSPTSDQLDITSHNSTSRFRESVPGGGLLETGELQITANYDPSIYQIQSYLDANWPYKATNDINSLVRTMDWPDIIGDHNGFIAPAWEIKFATTSVRFHGRVSAATFGSPIDGVHTVDLTIKVDGEITWPS